jgi:hypothetical protein
MNSRGVFWGDTYNSLFIRADPVMSTAVSIITGLLFAEAPIIMMIPLRIVSIGIAVRRTAYTGFIVSIRFCWNSTPC